MVYCKTMTRRGRNSALLRRMTGCNPSGAPQWCSAVACHHGRGNQQEAYLDGPKRQFPRFPWVTTVKRISLLEDMGVSKSGVFFVFEFRLINPWFIPSNNGVQENALPVVVNVLCARMDGWMPHATVSWSSVRFFGTHIAHALLLCILVMDNAVNTTHRKV